MQSHIPFADEWAVFRRAKLPPKWIKPIREEDPKVMSMLSVVALFAFLALIAYLIKSRIALMIAGFFTIFPLVYRSIDVTVLDVFGPFYTRELNEFVGGNLAAPMFIYAALAFIIPLMLVFPDKGRPFDRLVSEWTQESAYHRLLANGAFAFGVGVLAVLALNFVITGTVPILQGIDRVAYSQSAGPVHNIAYELNFLLNFIFGAFTVLPRLNGRGYDMRFAALAAALIGYWVVTGNRFRVFFVLISFYFLPGALVIIARKAGRIGDLDASLVGQRILTSRLSRFSAFCGASVMVAGLLYNSYYNVRDYREPLYEVQERVLVQPVHLWANAWDRVEFAKVSDPINTHAAREILDPIDASRNSTIQYLMTLELGYFRAAELTRLGQAYNGGYPEVHFELLGAWLPFISLPLMGFLSAWFLCLCLRLLYRNLVLTSILGFYVYFGLTLHYTSGMLTFALAPTYWIKIVLFMICWAVERHLVQRGQLIEAHAALEQQPGPRAIYPA